MQRVFANDYWTVDRDSGRALLILRRTSIPYPSIPVLTKAFDELDAALNATGRSRFSLLVDLRDVVGRNDPDFERATASHPRRLVKSFLRAAVLVRTANGLLQIQRSARTVTTKAPAFTSEAKAIEYLCPALTKASTEEVKPPART